MITPVPVIQQVLDVLNGSGLPYFVAGSLATSAYGEPRSTIDADIVIDARKGDIQTIIRALRTSLDLEAQMAFESVSGNFMHRLRDPKSGYVFELFEMADDPHDQDQVARRRKIRYFERDAFFSTVEDSIIAKL